MSELPEEHIFMLSFNWIPKTENGAAEAIVRPSREAATCITPAALKGVWTYIGLFNVDHMTCTASVLQSPLSRDAPRVSSQCDCAGSAGTGMLVEDTSIVAATRCPVSGCCVAFYHGRTHCLSNTWRNSRFMRLLTLSGVKAYWFSL